MQQKFYLYGKHALIEALSTRPDVVKKVFLSTEAAADQEIATLLKKARITPASMKGDAKQLVGGDAVHNGVIAVIDQEKLYSTIEDAFRALEKREHKCIVILDELHDPHNVGAIIRSAVAFGAGAIFVPKHNQAPITPVVVKTSAGMVFKVPIVEIGNVNQVLRDLKEKGYWAYALVMGGTTVLKDAVFDTPTVFVVGNESTGVRQKTLELCDVTLSVPMDPMCESLNAATAASVVLYEWSRTNLS